jgi:hypothetical protein
MTVSVCTFGSQIFIVLLQEGNAAKAIRTCYDDLFRVRAMLINVINAKRFARQRKRVGDAVWGTPAGHRTSGMPSQSAAPKYFGQERLLVTSPRRLITIT